MPNHSPQFDIFLGGIKVAGAESNKKAPCDSDAFTLGGK